MYANRRRKSRPSLPPTDRVLQPTTSAALADPAAPAAPVQGTKRKSIFIENFEDLANVDESIKKKPFSSFSKVPTNFDGSKYSFNFSVEPNQQTTTMSSDNDLFDLDDISLSAVSSAKRPKLENGKPFKNETSYPENGVAKASVTNKHENFDDFDLDDSFEDMLCDIENSPDAVLKPEGFRTATGTLIAITDEQRQRAMERFKGLTDLTKEIAGFIWYHNKELL